MVPSVGMIFQFQVGSNPMSHLWIREWNIKVIKNAVGTHTNDDRAGSSPGSSTHNICFD